MHFYSTSHQSRISMGLKFSGFAIASSRRSLRGTKRAKEGNKHWEEYCYSSSIALLWQWQKPNSRQFLHGLNEFSAHLLANNMTLVGTVRRSKRFLPQEFQTGQGLKKGDAIFGFQKKTTIVAYKSN